VNGKCFGTWTFDKLDEDFGASDTVNVTGIVTKEYTAKRGEGAEKIRLPGHRRLDAIDIASGSQRCATFRHDGMDAIVKGYGDADKKT